MAMSEPCSPEAAHDSALNRRLDEIRTTMLQPGVIPRLLNILACAPELGIAAAQAPLATLLQHHQGDSQ
jgi:hypothetical protein